MRNQGKSEAVRVIWSIQYLRAIAAIVVVAYHQLEFDFAIAYYGNFGVDLFFVISGFIIVSLTDRRNIGPRSFLFDRITRIVPLYWLVTLIAFGAAAGGYTIGRATDDPVALIKSLFFIPHFNVRHELFPLVGLGWTLNYEMFFYTLFAPMLLLTARTRLWAVGGALIFLVILGRIMEMSDPFLLTYTDQIVIEFLIGGCLGAIFGASLDRLPSRRTLCLVLALILGTALLSWLFSGPRYGLAALLVVAAALGLERIGKVPHIVWLKRLGDGSYSIYICQFLGFSIAYLMAKGAAWAFDLSPGFGMGLGGRLASVGVAVMTGMVVHLIFEKPVTRWLRHTFGMTSRTTLSGATGTISSVPN